MKTRPLSDSDLRYRRARKKLILRSSSERSASMTPRRRRDPEDGRHLPLRMPPPSRGDPHHPLPAVSASTATNPRVSGKGDPKERKRKGLFSENSGRGSGGIGAMSPVWCRGPVPCSLRTIQTGQGHWAGKRNFYCICSGLVGDLPAYPGAARVFADHKLAADRPEDQLEW